MRLIFAAALALVSATVIAQEPTTPGKPDPALAVAGRYTVDSQHTQVLFTVDHLGFSEYTGQFTQPTGTMTLDPKTPNAAKVSVSFPIDKVSTTVAALDAHLKKPEFFDAVKFPTGTFESTRVVASGTNATITGNLTLKGVTKLVTLQARFVGAGPGMTPGNTTNVGFRATTTILRSDFGISYDVPIVSDRVDLVINAAFAAE